jgi:hypothetical protein
MPKKSAAADPNIQALNLGAPQGALQLPPATRKPTRGALGGSAPRGARSKLPPQLAAAQRGGTKAKKSTPKKRKATA